MPRKAGQSTKPTGETSEQTLARLAEQRVNKIASGISSLGKLSRLKPTDEQREKVFSYISETMAAAHEAWKGQKPEVQRFSLQVHDGKEPRPKKV